MDILDAYQVLEQVYRELICIEVLGGLSVREALQQMRNMLESAEHHHMGYQSPGTCSERRGRPSFHIPQNQLAFLLEKQFIVPDILGVSIRTVRRHMSENDLSVHALYAQLSNQELDDIVRDIQTQFPTCGNRQMQGHLLSLGIRVQQYRVRESQRRIDPSGSILQGLRVICRCQYEVYCPSALWHIDRNHKLIR